MMFGKRKKRLKELEEQFKNESKKMNDHIIRRRLIHKYLLDESHEVFLLDHTGHVLRVNAEAKSKTGFSSKDFKRFDSVLSLFGGMNKIDLRTTLRDVLEKGSHLITTFVNTKNGDTYRNTYELISDSGFIICRECKD